MKGWHLEIVHSDGNNRSVDCPDINALESEVTDELAADCDGMISLTITAYPL